MPYLILKYLHVIGATVVLGTGAGIAFFMLMAHLSRDTAFVARTAGIVVLADMIFTATAIIAQPLTGYLLIRATGTSVMEGWVVASLVLYGVAGVLCSMGLLELSGFLLSGCRCGCVTSPRRRRRAAKTCRRHTIGCSAGGSPSVSRVLGPSC